MPSLLEYIPAIGEVIDRVLPDPKQKEQLKYELAKLQADENVARMNVLQSMFQHKSLFVAGGIPSLIWIGVLSLLNNYVLMPWMGVIGLSAPAVELPEQYWTLLGWIVTGLFGKKIVDDNAWFWKGKLVSPSITTFDQNNDELSKAMVDLLLRVINGENIPPEKRNIIIEPLLIKRESA